MIFELQRRNYFRCQVCHMLMKTLGHLCRLRMTGLSHYEIMNTRNYHRYVFQRNFTVHFKNITFFVISSIEDYGALNFPKGHDDDEDDINGVAKIDIFDSYMQCKLVFTKDNE